ncbi:hypothetical protein HPB48_002088 [Haemaphysalis longicornis]|uniref:YqaJ viral recombinase domain-containing protein n=1 Tax=Haemaphysalis longicornis TaxID=44386 RepID=A0A9J6F7I9_HAELO|nr:hypothetical protein HPB48_002088 [Haemaphysalis longicornis]
MQKGLQKETEAREVYWEVMTADGHGVEVCETGLVIWQHFPLMGCSPDGLVSFLCECFPARQTLLEIKCLVKVANSFSKDSPKPHNMTQVQVQMGIVGISTRDFLRLRVTICVAALKGNV